jgi:predicted  nucleic acid-binding Zn-ribbon protein
MAATYRCEDCGHTAGCGKDSPPSLCPECGGNKLTLERESWPWPGPTAPPAPTETSREGE